MYLRETNDLRLIGENSAVQQQLVLIDNEELNQLRQSIEELKKLFLTSLTTVIKPKKDKVELNMEDVENWIPLKLAWKKIGISKFQWYNRYQKIIKHKTFGGNTWLYMPSILKFFDEDQIN